MKKVLMVLGSLFLVLVLVLLFLFMGNGEYDKESKKYVDRVVPIILADLKKETLFKYSSKELKDAVSDEDADKLFKWFEKLGKFQEYGESTGAASTIYNSEKGKVVTAQYMAQSKFEEGNATIVVGMVKRDGKWLIYNFRINSKALLN